MLVRDMIQAVVGGGAVSDAEIVGAAYGVENYSLQFGYDGCTRENVAAYDAALSGLRARLSSLRSAPAPLSAEDEARVDVALQIADIEDRAQSAEDREDYVTAGRLRAQARAIRGQVSR